MKIYLKNQQIILNNPELKQKGAYAIGFRLNHDRNIRVGSLGLLSFKAGDYFYFGNAYGGGGLASRLKRHISRDKKKHWHFDYIRPYVTLTDIYAYIGGNECDLVKEYQQKFNAIFIHKKLGSMDCTTCPSHFIVINNPD